MINPINMPCYIKGEEGVQTPWLPHVGLKEERGGGVRPNPLGPVPLLVQFGLGGLEAPLLGAPRPHGPSLGPCGWHPLFLLYLINISLI